MQKNICSIFGILLATSGAKYLLVLPFSRYFKFGFRLSGLTIYYPNNVNINPENA